MPRPPNRSRRKHRRVGFFIPSEPSSSSLSTSSDSKLQTVIDFDHLFHSSQSEFHQFLAAGENAYRDLQTLISFDVNRRMIVSCRRSTLRFVGVVGNPLSPAKEKFLSGSQRVSNNWVRVEKKLPKWWPSSMPHHGFTMDVQDYQREANRLIRDFGHGVDFQDGWMMLGHLSEVVSPLVLNIMSESKFKVKVAYYSYICKVIGLQVSFGTTNTRDTFYRASVNFVLNVCSRASSDSTITQIHGEGVRQFIAGLAENIGLENFRAARIVSAAVAHQHFHDFYRLGLHGQYFFEMASSFDRWEKDPFFPMAEEVQESADSTVVREGIEPMEILNCLSETNSVVNGIGFKPLSLHATSNTLSKTLNGLCLKVAALATRLYAHILSGNVFEPWAPIELLSQRKQERVIHKGNRHSRDQCYLTLIFQELGNISPHVWTPKSTMNLITYEDRFILYKIEHQRGNDIEQIPPHIDLAIYCWSRVELHELHVKSSIEQTYVFYASFKIYEVC
ncbi:hypothetical protein FNV43_RR02361 [Rhamnella rubrinervis]|uniref:Uncharacterized protein n=1 Tax=Rhamnella rubrinervis TaxID=2594499 RepID=A0A8K0MTQ3_9ROSA|nr:hypothetical protein FNV43_RR02361 [Rhamnella rubrinervis]